MKKSSGLSNVRHSRTGRPPSTPQYPWPGAGPRCNNPLGIGWRCALQGGLRISSRCAKTQLAVFLQPLPCQV